MSLQAPGLAPGYAEIAAHAWRRVTSSVFLMMALIALAICAGIVAAILRLTDGVFIYPLDDPYIHLALGDQIRQGHYGINPGERSSPSSSILFPLLLAATGGTAIHVYMPLAWGIAGTLISLAAIGRVVHLAGLDHTLRARLMLTGALVFAGLCFNLFGVMFTGMEHALHIAASLLILAGIIEVAGGRAPPWWLACAIIAAPLLRFEGLALAGAGCLALVLLGHWRLSQLAVAAICACFAAYLATMYALGLPMLPSSVLLKSSLAKAGVAADPNYALLAVFVKLAGVFEKPRALTMLALGMLVCAAPFVLARVRQARPPWGDVVVAGLVAAGVLAHLAGGDYGWWGRYEIYVLMVTLVAGLYLYREVLRALFGPRGEARAAGAGGGNRSGIAVATATVALLLFVYAAQSFTYVATLFSTPGAALNIYQQQYQMARFAKEFYRAPVAVNDLGLVAWRNEHHVLDLYGLGSEVARKARAVAGKDTAWMEQLAAQYRTGVAMIYRVWFEAVPPGWVHVATLRLGARRYTASDENVHFYRTPQGDQARVREALDQLRSALPQGVALDLHGE